MTGDITRLGVMSASTVAGGATSQVLSHYTGPAISSQHVSFPFIQGTAWYVHSFLSLGYHCPFDGCEWTGSMLSNTFRHPKTHFSTHHTSQSAAPTTSSQRETVAVSIVEVQAHRSRTVVESNGLESDDGVLPM